MSELTEALEIIYSWLEENQPNCAEALEPGLTDNQIAEQLKDLSIKLPNEVYELYQWHDGTSGSFLKDNDDIRFLSLWEAIDLYQNWNTNIFPLFFRCEVCFFIAVDDQEKVTSPIFSNDDKYLPDEPTYDSLTDMMALLAEQLETENLENIDIFN